MFAFYLDFGIPLVIYHLLLIISMIPCHSRESGNL